MDIRATGTRFSRKTTVIYAIYRLDRYLVLTGSSIRPSETPRVTVFRALGMNESFAFLITPESLLSLGCLITIAL